jgi:hypothetical protein
VFIVGMPRSGTTLLAAMLNSHPDIAIVPELHYFTQHWVTCRTALEPGGIGAAALIDELAQTATFGDLKLTPAEIDRIRQSLRRPGVTHRGVYRAFLDVYAERRGKSVVGEKTPPYLLRLPLISSFFTAARYICIVRDPRGVSLSWQRARWRGGATYHALLWRRYYRAAQRYRAAIGQDFLLVRYEQLLEDPRGVLSRCCAFLGTPFDERMLTFHEGEGRNFDPEREPWKRKATTPLDPANAETWRTQLPAADIAVIELITARLLRAAGYVPSGERISLSDARSMGKAWTLDVARSVRMARRRRRDWGQKRSESLPRSMPFRA